MKARDIMTAPVITVGADMPVREIAALLLERRISGAPVVEGGRVICVVSEGDLLRRHEIGTDRSPAQRSWWVELIESDRASTDYVKSHARRRETS